MVTVVGNAPLPPERQPMAAYTMSDAGFFHLAGLPLREGRLFEARDNATSPAVAVVNEAFVRAVSPDAPLLGRQVRLLGVTDTPLEVVGVVSDARPFRLGGQERPRLFYPYSQFASTRVIGMVRIADGGAPPVNAIRGDAARTRARRADVRSANRSGPPVRCHFRAALGIRCCWARSPAWRCCWPASA